MNITSPSKANIVCSSSQPLVTPSLLEFQVLHISWILTFRYQQRISVMITIFSNVRCDWIPFYRVVDCTFWRRSNHNVLIPPCTDLYQRALFKGSVHVCPQCPICPWSSYPSFLHVVCNVSNWLHAFSHLKEINVYIKNYERMRLCVLVRTRNIYNEICIKWSASWEIVYPISTWLLDFWGKMA